jgi:Dynein heavy chain, N-terminal region 2
MCSGQGMMANRYMATFKDDILAWNARLNAVADVSQAVGDIQRTWAYLESLFIGSEEVRRELPEAADRFALIDSEVKAILKVNTFCGFLSFCLVSPPPFVLFCFALSPFFFFLVLLLFGVYRLLVRLSVVGFSFVLLCLLGFFN